MWPFSKKLPPAPRDLRRWNEDWQVGDTAECIVDGISVVWHPDMPPWDRPAFGRRFTVIGFSDELARDNTRRYFLTLDGWPKAVCTEAFRKVRPLTTDQSEVVSRILNARPGADRVREPTDIAGTAPACDRRAARVAVGRTPPFQQPRTDQADRFGAAGSFPHHVQKVTQP